MHVKRQLNKLFGSFRSSSPNKNQRLKIPFQKQEHTQSKWELVDNEKEIEPEVSPIEEEVNLEEVKAQLDKGLRDYTPPKPSLLKRTLSRKKKKKEHLLEEGNQDLNEKERTELRGVVEEINRTIGFLSQYEEKVKGEDTKENIFEPKEESYFPCTWCDFEENLSSIPEDPNEIVSVWEEREKTPEWDLAEGAKISKQSVLRNSGRKLFNRIKGNGKILDSREEEVESKDNWVRRSFRKVLRRKKDNFNPVPAKQEIEVTTQPKGMKRILKKGLMGFGRSMVHASAAVPLPCECPLGDEYPRGSAYYYEDENDSFQEYRRYCERKEQDFDRTYQVGYCP